MDAVSFQALFLPAAKSLYTVALKLTMNSEEAEDLVQETFLRLWQSRHTLPELNVPSAYAIRTLRHLFLAQARRANLPTADVDWQNLSLKAPSLENKIVAADTYDRLCKAIAQLPDPQNRVMMMRDVEGRELSEIAEITGLSLSNVRQTLCRARQKIRALVKQ